MTIGAAVFPIQPARTWRWVGIGLGVVAGGVLLASAWRLGEQGRFPVTVLSLALLVPLIGLLAWRGGAEGRLLLDGGLWAFEPARTASSRRAGDLVVSIDLGDWMLLQFRPEGARWPRDRHWLALSRSDMPADWQAFRRAVYSSRSPPAGLSAQAPADPPA